MGWRDYATGSAAVSTALLGRQRDCRPGSTRAAGRRQDGSSQPEPSYRQRRL